MPDRLWTSIAATDRPVVQRLDWRRYQLPFQRDFSTSQGVAGFRYGAIVRVAVSDGHTGTGEVAPLPLSQPAALLEALRPAAELEARLAGRTLDEALGYFASTSEAAGRALIPGPLRFGVETALLDALCRSTGNSSLADALPGEPPSSRKRAVPVNAVIGGGSAAESVRCATAAVAAGFTCLKLKVGLFGSRAECEIDRVRAVRESVGSEIELRLDANGAWNLTQAATVLHGCLPYAIAYVEQPLPTESLHELPRLRERAEVPIALDEAVTDLASARRILDSGGADILIVKPQVVGGAQLSRRIIQEAAARGVDCVLTSAIESGIGTAATLQLAAALPEVQRACGLATLPLLADDLIVEELVVHAGTLLVPEAAGLGVTLDEAALDHYQLPLE